MHIELKSILKDYYSLSQFIAAFSQHISIISKKICISNEYSQKKGELKVKYSIRKDLTPLYQCMKPHTMREGSVTNYHKEQVDRIFFLCNMYWSKEYCRVLLCTYKMYIPLNSQKKGPTVRMYACVSFYILKSATQCAKIEMVSTLQQKLAITFYKLLRSSLSSMLSY